MKGEVSINNSRWRIKENIVIGLFFLSVFINFLGPIADVDFPFHLKTGEYIYQHKGIPKDDPFSVYGEGVSTERERFTLSQYWLAQVLFYKLYSTSGPSGIIFLRAFVFSTFIFLLWFASRKRGLFPSLLIVTLIAINLLPYKLDRPQFFSFLFTLILILLFEKFREKPKSAMPLFFIPPLMLLWSNIHAGFVFGLVVILFYTFSETLKYFVKKTRPGFPVTNSLSEKSILMLLLTGLLAILFSYINPDFNGQILVTIDSHTNAKWLYYGVKEYMSPIEETRDPFGVWFANIVFWIIFGFVCIVTALNIVRKKSIDLTTFALIFFASVAALTSVRYVPFFMALVIPLTKDYRFFREKTFLRHFTESPIMIIFFSIFFIITIWFGLKFSMNMFTISKHRFYPEKVANFLLNNHIDTNIFNSSNRGSYLLWRLYPHYKVFQDTRYISLEATAESIAIRDALEYSTQPSVSSFGNALSALVPEKLGKIKISIEDGASNKKNSKIEKPLWKALLDKYNIDLIVHEATADFTGDIYILTLRLINDDDWVLIYLDGIMQIFIRNDKKYSDIINKYKKPKELVYDEIMIETAHLVKKKITSSAAYSSLAFALIMKGEEEDAKKMIEAALALNKKDLVAHFCNAYLALKEKDRKMVDHNLEKASYATKQLAE
jgi:hypothetical protein